MNSKERFLNSLSRKKTDRLPVTTHHVMPSFLRNYMNGITDQEFFDYFGLDPIRWFIAFKPDMSAGEFYDPLHSEIGFLEAHRICTESWRFSFDEIIGQANPAKRMNIITPKKTLSMVLQSDEHTTWLCEHVIKEKSDIDILASYMPSPKCDIDAVNKAADEFSERGILRGHIPTFDGFGQPGCWQDAACMYGVENLITAALQDPEWVHSFLKILMERKRTFIKSLRGARYDILELGGGDASTTVISPDIFDEFVAPYDSSLIASAHEAGHRIVYHTCGGMMPILEKIEEMKPDAMETFTPPAMGGDTILEEAKQRIGDRVCMIGGFDQFHFFTGCTEEETRMEVRRCFGAAGSGGGYILSPSDHFFEADLKLIRAFADEAIKCVY
ncbi:MAG TPA: uroporphyrinogen decarboxylase family protein [Bacteroidales bacterium]|nr:uroporphyrinogen decarboxylase family protein [Bacteroidales bacterium]